MREGRRNERQVIDRLPRVDLWAPVATDGLPPEITDALRDSDWRALRKALRAVLDPTATDANPYGRALLQAVRRVPFGVDPVLDRCRAAADLDHGDWDDLQQALRAAPSERQELIGLRDIVLATPDQTRVPPSRAPHHAAIFAWYEYEFQRNMRAFRRAARRMLNFSADVLWSRPDISPGLHLRYRRVQDVAMLAIGEAHAGRLIAAIPLADEAARATEHFPLGETARDLAALCRVATRQADSADIGMIDAIAKPTGLSPLGAWQVLNYELPFLSLIDAEQFRWSAELSRTIGQRLASPRALLQADSWCLAAELSRGVANSSSAGLATRARTAVPGLRALPEFLYGVETQHIESIVLAERLARSAGLVWLQVACLTWAVALGHRSSRTAQFLQALLRVTGWRLPPLAPRHVIAAAADQLVRRGLLGVEVLEVAEASADSDLVVRAAVATSGAAGAPDATRIAAVNLLGRTASTSAREALAKISRRTDAVGTHAASLLHGRTSRGGLSERELEVLDLAGRGLTNKQIAERLTLSPHTIARHLANARLKLGAANRTEAAARLGDLHSS